MAYEQVSDVTSGEPVTNERLNTIKSNIDDIRSRLVEAGSYSWGEFPTSDNEIVENEDINELKSVLDDSENFNNCQDCTDNVDRTDNGDLVDKTDNGDDTVDTDDNVDSNNSYDGNHGYT